MAGGILSMSAIFSSIFKILGPLLTIVYPAAASFEALETPGPDDDKQWLTYWVIHSTITLLEYVAAPVIAWIPFYTTIKLLFVAWMVLPQFRGAFFLYVKFIRPQGLQVRKQLYDQFGDQSHLIKGGVKSQ